MAQSIPGCIKRGDILFLAKNLTIFYLAPGGCSRLGASRGRKFFKSWLQNGREMLGIARNYFFNWICGEKIKINEFFQPKSVNFCLKNHFFTCWMVKEAFSRFGKWRNRFLDAKNGGIYSFLCENIDKIDKINICSELLGQPVVL